MTAAAQPIWDRYWNDEVAGWQHDNEAIEFFAAKNPYKNFAQAAPRVMDAGKRKGARLYRYLWQALRTFHKNPEYRWRPQWQDEGTCVGQGSKLAADIVAAIASIIRKQAFRGRYSVAAMYAGSRVDIGRRPGSWQGSTGAWAAEWLTKFGGVPLSAIGLPDDELKRDEALAMQWTRSSAGVPTEYETVAKENPIGFAALCRDYEEAEAAIENGNVVLKCSNLLPNGKRDKHGFMGVRRGGGHCELYAATRPDMEGLLCIGSWADFGDGPLFEDQPDGSWWHDRDVVNATLAQGDSYVIGPLEGLEPLDASLLI